MFKKHPLAGFSGAGAFIVVGEFFWRVFFLLLVTLSSRSNEDDIRNEAFAVMREPARILRA